jgi:hypothetical protein
MALRMGPGRVDQLGTESLRRIAKLRAKNHGDLSSAVISAGYYARKLGKTMYAYVGSSFMTQIWRVSYKPSEYLDAINNTGFRMVSVTPDLIVAWHDLERG